MYEKIIKEYYSAILFYCLTHLGDMDSAKDCTQEVFLLLHIKMNQLNLSINIEGWLYAVADRKMKEYRRKNPSFIDIENIPEQIDKSESSSTEAKKILDTLDEEERNLLESYYGETDRQALAESMGLSINALYLRVGRIRKKLAENMDAMHKKYC